MKLTINKLIANDIINYGLEHTDSFNYSVSLKEYLNEYEKKEQEYILENLEEIFNDIGASEVVAEVTIEEYDNDKHFYMTYYWESVLDETEKKILEVSNSLNKVLEYEDIKDIADDLLFDNEINDKLIDKVKNYNSRDMEMN